MIILKFIPHKQITTRFYLQEYSQNLKKQITPIVRLLNILDQNKLLKKKYFIKVKKNIPTNSGLGGGSMNAGSVLKFFVSKKLVKLSKKRFLKFVIK